LATKLVEMGAGVELLEKADRKLVAALLDDSVQEKEQKAMRVRPFVHTQRESLHVCL
jgi:hypothetical protein